MAEAKREVRLILPVRDNDGKSLNDVHTELQAILSLNYGGFTCHNAAGGWHNGEQVIAETVTIYNVAVPDNQKTYEKFVRLAEMLCVRARQETIYLRWTSGHVRLVRAKPSEHAVDAHGECEICGKWYAEDICFYVTETGQYIGPCCKPSIGQVVDRAVAVLEEPLDTSLDPCPSSDQSCQTCPRGDTCYPPDKGSIKKNLSPLAQALSALADLAAKECEPHCPGPPVNCQTCEHGEVCHSFRQPADAPVKKPNVFCDDVGP